MPRTVFGEGLGSQDFKESVWSRGVGAYDVRFMEMIPNILHVPKYPTPLEV